MLKSKKSKIILVVVAVVVLIVITVIWTILAPSGTVAAKYGIGKYIYEKDVTEYIQTYQSQEGMLNSSDEEWADFLKENDLTPESLRKKTIDQLLYDTAIRDQCIKLGITVTEEEIDEATNAFKEAMSFGDEDIWEKTLEMYGQTDEGFRSVYELELLKQKLIEQEVQKQEPTEDDVREYIDAIAAQGVTSTKHSFAFKLSVPEDVSSSDTLKQVNKILKEFLDGDQSKESFAALVQLFSDNDDLIQTQGANGWDLDQSGYSDEYIAKLSELEQGDTSNVFVDGDDYCFIFVSDVYKFPQVEQSDIDLDSVPESLLEYFEDATSELLTDDEGERYIQRLVEAYGVTYEPMPEDVPYNVDMSLAEEPSETDISSDGATSANAGSSSADSTNSSASSNDLGD